MRNELEWPTAAAYLPERSSLTAARRAAAGCRGCPLWENATQTVFGAGPANAPLMLIGEQPGDQEDLSGEPFVGPAGKLLDRALQGAGIARAETYVTNAVKHFKWEPRGKRRIHRKPDSRELNACFPWLHLEIDLIKPSAIVCLGATAARTLLGPAFRVTRDRGRFVKTAYSSLVLATIHPSALLRLREAAEREAELQRLTADLALVKRTVG
jgi:uracil-DNA glycosylase family protein